MSESLPNHDQNAKGEHCPEQPMSAPASANLEEIVEQLCAAIFEEYKISGRDTSAKFRKIIQSAIAPVQAELEQERQKVYDEFTERNKVCVELSRCQSRFAQAEEELQQAKEGEAAMDRLHQTRMAETAEASRDMAQKLEKAEADAANYNWLRKFNNFNAVNSLLDKEGIDTLDQAISCAQAKP